MPARRLKSFPLEAAQEVAKPEPDMSRIKTNAEKYGLHDA
jgi:hypothetical protein